MKNLLTLIVLFTFSHLSAQDFVITHFDINVTINVDGSLDVTETIDVRFNQERRGIYRDIENMYESNGKRYSLNIHDIRVEGHEHKVTSGKQIVNIRIGNPNVYVSGNQQYKISYSIENGILPFPEHQEFHYDFTGNQWNTTMDKVDFTINLPRGLTLSKDDMLVTGGRRGQNLNIAEIAQVSPTMIKGGSTQRLESRSGITAAIRLPKTYLDVAANKITYYESPKPKDYNPWYVAIPMAIFGFFLTFWRRLRNTNNIVEDENVKIYPPEGLTSAHIGAFVDQTSNTRDIVSLLPYWGAEGFLEMKQIGKDIFLYKVKNLPPNFPEYEHIIFDRLFKYDDVAKLEDLQTKFYTTLSKAQKMLTNEVVLQDYYDPRYQKLFRSWKLVIFPLSMIVLGVLSIVILDQLYLAIGFFIVALGGFILPFFRLPLTEKGATLKAEIKAFQRFIKEPDRKLLSQVVQEDPEYFNKMLPFAVAFGLEKGFLKDMEPYLSIAPFWFYSDMQHNSFANFGQHFKPEVIQSAFTSMPAGSSSGSSSGSFSAGSGIGGGGGGSW